MRSALSQSIVPTLATHAPTPIHQVWEPTSAKTHTFSTSVRKHRTDAYTEHTPVLLPEQFGRLTFTHEGQPNDILASHEA